MVRPQRNLEDKMVQTGKDIVLISEDSAFSERIGAIVRRQPGYVLKHCTGTLSTLNGRVYDLAKSSELIIFRATTDAHADIEALKGIAKNGATARILAVSDSSVPFGVAHSLLQVGATEVVPDTVTDVELGRILSRLSMPRRLTLTTPEIREGQVIAISKARGGIGATTLAVNLADHLCVQKKRFGKSETRKIVLVDLDLQFGAIAGFLDLQPNEALYSLAKDRIDPDSTFLEQAIEKTASGLAVIAAPDGFMPLNALQPDQIRALIYRLQQTFDYVIVDLPHAMVDWLTPVLEAASHVLIVSGTSVPFVQQTRRLIDFFKDQNPSLKIEVVVGQEKKPLLKSRRHAEAAKALETEFRHWLPPDARAAEEAMDRGRPLSQTASGSGLNKEIARLAAHLLNEAAQDRTPKNLKAERRER